MSCSDEDEKNIEREKRTLEWKQERKLSARSCMTNLERDQLLPTAPEVGFEVAMTLACSWNIALHIYCFYLHAIDRYRGYCSIIIPVSFPGYRSPGYGAKNFRSNVCDVDSGIHHVIIFTRPSPRYSYCKRR